MGGFSTIGLLWEQIKQKLENEGAKNKQYDSDIDGVLDLGAIPTITRDKLEYPTENVSFAYLASINKAVSHLIYRTRDTSVRLDIILTYDSFTDKLVLSTVTNCNDDVLVARATKQNIFYSAFSGSGASTADVKLRKIVNGTVTDFATESVDIATDLITHIWVLSVSGSALKLWRQDVFSVFDIDTSVSPNLSATDSDIASGRYGVVGTLDSNYLNSISSSIGGIMDTPATQLPKPIAIIEIDELKQNLVPISQLDNIPVFLKAEAKKYELLKQKGFTDEEIKELFGNIQTHVDLASVTWGAFDHKPERNTMLITITGGNVYTGEKAIQEQIEHAKSKNLKVLKPPRDYSEAVEQYRRLRQEFTGWIAGKDNYAYQTLGHEDFEKFQVADTYYGNIVDGIKPNAYKNVPDWEMRRTLAMWKDRLKRATIVKSEAEKHLKKLEEVEKKGW